MLRIAPSGGKVSFGRAGILVHCLDCGMFQGRRQESAEKNRNLRSGCIRRGTEPY